MKTKHSVHASIAALLVIVGAVARAENCPEPEDCWVARFGTPYPVWGTLAGYASQTSVAPNGTIYFRISGPYEPDFTYAQGKVGDVSALPYEITTIQIFRISGASSIQMTTGSATEFPRTVVEAPAIGAGGSPTDGYYAGFGWLNSYSLTIPDAWPSGVYYATLSSYAGGTWRIPFVVKSKPTNKGKILVVMPFATNNAYNAFGGKGLYPSNSSNGGASTSVSFERPGATGLVSTAPGDGVIISNDPEYLLTRWATNKSALLGKIDFATSIDLHADSTLTSGYKLVVLVSHDEYWSQQMRTNLENFRIAGGNIAALSGNTMYWRVTFGTSPTTGAANQVMTSAKNDATDHFFNYDGGMEELTLGVSSRVGMWYEGGSYSDYTYRVTGFGPSWVTADAGVGVGGVIGGSGLEMIGYETDGVPDKDDDGILEPTDPLFQNWYQLPTYVAPPNLSIIASRYISDAGVLPDGSRVGRIGNAAVTIWRDPHFTGADVHGWVFAAGSMWWSRCLWNYNTNTEQPWNAGQQVTINIFKHLGTDVP